MAVYIVNNENGLVVLGHSALLLEDANGNVELFSFCPSDNHTAAKEGSVASIVNRSDSLSFSTFRSACKSGGILIDNGYMKIREEFTRYIRLSVSKYYYYQIRTLAYARKSNPPFYVAVSYNCQSFVSELLSAGNVTLRSRGDSLAYGIIPNQIYEAADSTTTGTRFLEKGKL